MLGLSSRVLSDAINIQVASVIKKRDFFVRVKPKTVQLERK